MPTRFKKKSCIVVPDHTSIVPISEKTTKRPQCSCRCVYRSSSAPIRYNIDEAAEKLQEPRELCPAWFTLTQQTSAGEANEIWADIIWRPLRAAISPSKQENVHLLLSLWPNYTRINNKTQFLLFFTHAKNELAQKGLGGSMQVLSSGMSSYSPGWRNE